MNFYIYDDQMKKKGVKKRCDVHRDGDWHRGVQLNIICGNELLMQQRTDKVDIAKNCFDQTLATQLITDDEESELKALFRGMKEELGITNLKPKRVFKDVKIRKTYKYDSTLHNNEFVSLYELRVGKKFKVKSNSEKVKRLFWKDIDKVKEDSTKNPQNYTQTFLMWLNYG